MNILIISDIYPINFNSINGFFVHQQVKKIQNEGYQIKIISPIPWTPFPIKYFSKKWKKYSEIPLKIIKDKLEIYCPRYLLFPNTLFFSISGNLMYWGLKKIIKNIYKSFDFNLIHAHVVLPTGYAAMKLAKKYKKPLIVTIHGQDFQQTIYKNKRCKRNIEKVINFSKTTIVVSDKLKNIGKKELNINHQKLITIPNGINIEDIYQGKSDLIEKYKGKKIILSVSNLIKIKGIDDNIKAISQLIKKYPDLIYLIIGDGLERKNLENLTKELKIESHVEFLEQLPHDKTMEYISICDIFSLPSWNEGFGVVYLEAMANGKPVIAVKGQGIDGIIEDKKNGLMVKPQNVNNLIKSLDLLISSPNLMAQIGERGKKDILENYTWEKISKKIIETYK